MSNGILGNVTFARHFIDQVKAKGFRPEQILSAVRTPERVTEVRRYPGQLRYCGAGVAVVADGNHLITVYADQVVTPLRPDQMADPEARASRRLARG